MPVVGIKVGFVAAKLLGDVHALYVFDVGLFIEPGTVGVFEPVECPGSVGGFLTGVYFKKFQ